MKKQHDAVRDSAKTKRSKARKRSATAEEVAAIDAEAEAQRAAISLQVFAISHMPAADSEIVERRHTLQMKNRHVSKVLEHGYVYRGKPIKIAKVQVATGSPGR